MRINLLPAIVLAGPPHSGKSVLAYLLTQRLTEAGVAHYLLRAVPDGEGNWFFKGEATTVRALRLRHKVGYSTGFVNHMCKVINQRTLPLLVDVGGFPTSNQLCILQACTHSILLFRTVQEQQVWEKQLSGLGLLPLAILQSNQEGINLLDTVQPIITGSISGLERDQAIRSTGEIVDLLAQRIAGIFRYEREYFEKLHFQNAPLPVVTEEQLAQQINITITEKITWYPQDLSKITPGAFSVEGCALYGRGPVWLSAAVAAKIHPWPFAIFDIRYGWISIPDHLTTAPNENIEYQIQHSGNVIQVEARLPYGFFEPEDFYAPQIPSGCGVVFSGTLPRWAYAILTRHAIPHSRWVGIFDPALKAAVIVFSQDPAMRVGDTCDKLSGGYE